MFSKLKQFKDLRDQAKQLQNMLAAESIKTVSDSGKIQITMNGNQEITELIIDPSYLTPEKQNDLQYELKKTFNKAVKDVQRLMAEKIKQSGNFNLPGLT